jgi:predicted phage terminase large subunit-like protein
MYHSKGRWKLFPHLEVLNRYLLEVAAGRITRLAVFMPPRHGKSELCSHYFPAWYEGTFPFNDIILASYEADFAESWGRKARDVLGEVGKEVFGDGGELDSKQTAAKSWSMRLGGMMNTAGVGGPITGKGAHVAIIDDPVKNMEDALSATMRQKAWDWYQSVLYTRLEPNGAIILMMTRWHEDDLGGRILRESGEDWVVLALPAIAEDNDSMGRQRGEPLCPQRFDVEALTRIKANVGDYVWTSLYQQRPSKFEGSMLLRKWWRYYDNSFNPLPKKFDEVIQSWDMSFKDTKASDYVVGQVWGRRGSNRYLLDQVREKLSFTKTLDVVQQLSAKWPNARAKVVEDKANGPAVISALQNHLTGLIARTPEGSKESRVFAITPAAEAGNIWLPHPDICAWTSDFVDECSRFPTGVHDDQVDAMTQALLYLEQFSVSALDLLSVAPSED